MEQNKMITNLTNTVAVVGLSMSLFSGNVAFQVQSIDGNLKKLEERYGQNGEGTFKPLKGSDNCYSSEEQMTPLERESLALFGVMRDATLEEQAGVQKYIESISEDTGVSFFDLC